jgi:hypothetical protein
MGVGKVGISMYSWSTTSMLSLLSSAFSGCCRPKLGVELLISSLAGERGYSLGGWTWMGSIICEV